MTRKLLPTTICAFALALGLCGCGGSDDGANAPSIDEPADAIEVVEPAANVAPVDIDSGHVPLDAYQASLPWYDEGRTSDIWWKDGQEGIEGLFLTNAGNDAGKSVTWVDGDGNETASQFDLEVSDDGHLVSKEGADPAVDIVFNDPLTCYDAVSDAWYVRGDAAELAGLLEGLSLATEDGRWTVTFGEDGTFAEVYDEEEGTGTWEFISSCNVRLTYDNGPAPETLDVVRDETGQVIELSSSWNHLLVQ